MPKRIVFFPGGGMGDASARTRLYYYLPTLDPNRIRWHIASYSYHRSILKSKGKIRSPRPRSWLELLWVRTFFRVLICNVVWFQKLSVRPWVVKVSQIMGKQIVYDLDDAIYLRPPSGAGRGGHAIAPHEPNREIIEAIMRQANMITVSGELLAEFARQFAQDIRILPSLVNEVALRPSPSPNPPVICWVGAPENLRYLLAIEDVLLRLQNEFPGLIIRLITSKLQDQPRFPYEHIPWSLNAETEWIPKSTVGIAPLADDEWCRAKMNYKALVYLSHGVPAIITPGGFPLEKFVEGTSILAARTNEDWYQHLKQVISDGEFRQHLAANGLNVLRAEFSAAANVEKFTAALLGSNRKANG